MRVAWKEASALLLPASFKIGVRNAAVLVLTVGGMAFADQTLAARGLIPPSSNPAVSKLLASGFGVLAVVVGFAVYFTAEALFIAPYRLWKEREPPAPAAAAPLPADDETKRLAGLVNALRERVMPWGFKIPISTSDPFFGIRYEVESSTHPVWIEPEPAQARRDFLHACACLAHANTNQEERKEIEYWRDEITRSSAFLITRLLPDSS